MNTYRVEFMRNGAKVDVQIERAISSEFAIVLASCHTTANFFDNVVCTVVL